MGWGGYGHGHGNRLHICLSKGINVHFFNIVSKESDVDVGGRVGGINVFSYIV